MSELPRPDIKPIFQRGGYLHPILTPNGKLITDGLSAESSPSSRHLVSVDQDQSLKVASRIFGTWSEGKGRVEFVGGRRDLERSRPWRLPVRASVRRSDASEPKVALKRKNLAVILFTTSAEARAVTGWLTSLHPALRDGQSLKLPKYHYGGLGFRGHWTWNGRTDILPHLGGETDRVKGNETAGAGATSAAMWTVRALESPSCVTRNNFRAPQRCVCIPTNRSSVSRLRNSATGKSPQANRMCRATASSSPTARQTKAEPVERLWNDYAHPPTITID